MDQLLQGISVTSIVLVGLRNSAEPDLRLRYTKMQWCRMGIRKNGVSPDSATSYLDKLGQFT